MAFLAPLLDLELSLLLVMMLRIPNSEQRNADRAQRRGEEQQRQLVPDNLDDAFDMVGDQQLFKTPSANVAIAIANLYRLLDVDIWERNKELIRKRTDIGEHFTWEVIQSIVFIFLPLGERVHLTNPVYYY